MSIRKKKMSWAAAQTTQKSRNSRLRMNIPKTINNGKTRQTNLL
jgi:hypothetical protein